MVFSFSISEKAWAPPDRIKLFETSCKEPSERSILHLKEKQYRSNEIYYYYLFSNMSERSDFSMVKKTKFWARVGGNQNQTLPIQPQRHLLNRRFVKGLKV